MITHRANLMRASHLWLAARHRRARAIVSSWRSR